MTFQNAFDFLIDRARSELKSIQAEIKALSNQGRFDQIQQAALRGEQIQQLIDTLEKDRRTWEKTFTAGGDIITNVQPGASIGPVENELPFPALQHPAPKRALSRKEKNLGITPREEYKIPILGILAELGGRSDVKTVLERLEIDFEERFTPLDLENLPNKKQVRWRNSAHWARNEMVHRDGYLSAGSPFGIWEITQKGRFYLANKFDFSAKPETP